MNKYADKKIVFTYLFTFIWAALIAISAPSFAKINATQAKDFDRLVFDWESKVKYSVQRFGLELLIEFDQPVTGDMQAALQKLGQFIKSAKIQSAGKEVVIQFTAKHKYKVYRIENSISVEVGRLEQTRKINKLQKSKNESPRSTDKKVVIRVGEHPKYRRIVFELPALIKYKVQDSEMQIDLLFNEYFELDSNLKTKKANANLLGINSRKSNDGGLVVSIPKVKGSKFRHFLAGKKIVVDLFKQKISDNKKSKTTKLSPNISTGDASNNQDENKKFLLQQLGLKEVQQTNGEKPEKESIQPLISNDPKKEDLSSPKSQDSKSLSERKSKVSKSEKNIMITGKQADDGVLLRDSGTQAEKVLSVVDGAPSQIFNPSKWLVNKLAGDDKNTLSGPDVKVRLLKKNNIDSLFVDWGKDVPAAVFTRAGNLWVVFGEEARFDLSRVQNLKKGIIGDFRQLSVKGGTAILAKIAPGISPAVWRKGSAWVVDLSARITRPDVDLELVTQQTSPQGPRVFVLADGIGKYIETYDPVVGDRLFIVPLSPLSRGLKMSRRFAQFEILRSAQGLIVRPLIDELEIRVMPDGVAITASQFKGLEVSKRQTVSGQTISGGSQIDGLPKGLEPGRIFNLETWRQNTKPEEFLEMKQNIQQQISQATSIARGGPRLRLAQFYFSKGLAAETMGLLRTISDSDDEMARRPDVIALRGASHFILGRFLEAEKELDNKVLNGFSEAELWRGASNAAQGKWTAAIEHFARAGEIPGDYPRNFSIQLALLAAEAAIRAEDYRGAGVFLDAIAQGRPTIGEQARLNYLRGRVLYASSDTTTALNYWRRLTQGSDRWARVRAKRALIEHKLRKNIITRLQAIESLEQLRFAWRGDQLEFDLLRRLGELYIEEKDFPSGLKSLRQAVTFFPNNIAARAVSKKMTKSFSGIYTDGTSDAMTPLTALALYDQFRELTPVGRRGDKIIQRLADRLVEVDLLDRASILLDRQVRFRLQGVQKAQVGGRLALIRLLDRQPGTALEALDESVAPGLDPKLALQRKRLRARSVFELGDSETALKLINADKERDADLLRADIFWRTRNWVSAGKVFERLLGNDGQDGRRINDLSATLILNWVVALSMSEQGEALNKVRQIYSLQMDMTQYREAFRLITNKTEGDIQDFRTLTDRFKEIGRFQAFLTTYREKLKTKLLSEMN